MAEKLTMSSQAIVDENGQNKLAYFRDDDAIHANQDTGTTIVNFTDSDADSDITGKQSFLTKLVSGISVKKLVANIKKLVNNIPDNSDINNLLTVNVETGETASKAYSQYEILMWNNTLYIVADTIAQGEILSTNKLGLLSQTMPGKLYDVIWYLYYTKFDKNQLKYTMQQYSTVDCPVLLRGTIGQPLISDRNFSIGDYFISVYETRMAGYDYYSYALHKVIAPISDGDELIVNTNYIIVSLTDEIKGIVNNISPIIQRTSTATVNIDNNKLFWWNGNLYRSTAVINVGDTISATTSPINCVRTTISDEFTTKENISNKVTSITETSTDIQYPSAKAVNDRLKQYTPAYHYTEFVESLFSFLSDDSDVYAVEAASGSLEDMYAYRNYAIGDHAIQLIYSRSANTYSLRYEFFLLTMTQPINEGEQIIPGTNCSYDQYTNIIEDFYKKINKSDIVDNLTTNDATKVLSAKQGKQLQDTKVNTSDIVNNLTSTDIDVPLSAAMGKSLNDSLNTIGTVITTNEQTTSVPNGSSNNTTVDTITLTPGMWIVVGCVHFAAGNKTGVRMASISVGTILDIIWSNSATPAVTGSTYMYAMRILNVTAESTYRLIVRHTDGADLNCTDRIFAVKVGQ